MVLPHLIPYNIIKINDYFTAGSSFSANILAQLEIIGSMPGSTSFIARILQHRTWNTQADMPAKTSTVLS